MPSSPPNILIHGTGGHALVIADAIRVGATYTLAGCADDDPGQVGGSFSGLEVVTPEEVDAKVFPWVIIAIGDNAQRTAVARSYEQRGFRFGTVIHPAATVAAGVEIGEGSVVFAGAVINSAARIGRHAIINTRSSVDHHGLLGDGVHIAPGATLAGGVSVGDRTLVGVGATVLPHRTVGSDATVGAGAVVVHDVDADRTVVGNPARALDRHS